MNEKAQKYIDMKIAMHKEIENRRKYEFLLRENLVEKVYSPDNKYSNEYPEYEWDDNLKCQRYYKKMPIYLNDEEFDEVVKSYNLGAINYNISPASFYPKKNLKTSTSLKVLAWVNYVMGTLLALYFIEYNTTNFFIYLTLGISCGTMFLGFAKIIDLLDDIKHK